MLSARDNEGQQETDHGEHRKDDKRDQEHEQAGIVLSHFLWRLPDGQQILPLEREEKEGLIIGRRAHIQRVSFEKCLAVATLQQLVKRRFLSPVWVVQKPVAILGHQLPHQSKLLMGKGLFLDKHDGWSALSLSE